MFLEKEGPDGPLLPHELLVAKHAIPIAGILNAFLFSSEHNCRLILYQPSVEKLIVILRFPKLVWYESYIHGQLTKSLIGFTACSA